MKKQKKIELYAGLGLLMAFVLWTLLVRRIDRQGIGPNGSQVGFAALNGWFHAHTEVHFFLYELTDLFSLLPLCLILVFALMGLVQWIKRGSPWRVDRDILALGIFYTVVMAIYVFFEIAVVNYRPVLIEGKLEASYPSSTTVLVICVMLTACMIFHRRIQNKCLDRMVCAVIWAFTAFMVIGRLLSGVHWLTDIIGGALLGAALVTLYYFFATKINKKSH